MDRPRFAIACPDFYPQTCGVGDHALRLAGELRRRGYEAEIFTRPPAGLHPEDEATPVHAIEGRFPFVVARGIRGALRHGRFSHLVLEYVPHMWGAWRFGSAASVWLAAAARRAGMDVTVIAHELFIDVDARPDLFLGAIMQRAQIAAIARAADRLFVTTDTRAATLMPFWRAVGRAGRPGVMRIAPNVLPQPRVPAAGRARLGVFSTLALGKRFDVVLGAFEQVWRRRPESELVLIGDLGDPATDSRAAAMHDSVRRHPAADRIRMTGKLSLAEIAREMTALDVYLFPMQTGANTRSGTLPVALGSGLPVVAVKGIDTDLHLFRDGENILFATEMTADAFAAATVRVLDDSTLAARLASGARRLYEEHLSWSVAADTLLAALAIGPG